MPIRYLILALTSRCNMRCSYCYLGDQFSAIDMTEEVMGRAMSLAAADNEPFHLQLTGGEPTLVPGLVQYAAELAHATELCKTLGIQTNGSCLSLPLLEVFRSYDFQVGISLDGPPSIHQEQRGSAAETFRGLQLLESAGIPFRVTAVVSRTNVGSLDRLVMTLSGFTYALGIGLDLLIDKGRAHGAIHGVDTSDLEEGLIRMLRTLDLVNSRRQIPIRLRERDLLFSNKRKGDPVFCHACMGESMAVTPEGRIFPCGQTMGDPRFESGTVWSAGYKNLKKIARCRPLDVRCSDCEIESVCPGDCPSRLHYNRNKNPELMCVLYRTIWKLGKNKPAHMQEERVKT